MNTQQARNRVAETFPHPFNKGKFLEFSRNLLNKFDESKVSSWNSTYVKDAFKPHVSRFERLGTYTSPDEEKLDVLIVYLTAASKLERTRTALRNFVADHLKTRDNKDAALVAFVSPTEQQWRFSYIKMEYTAVENPEGNIGVQTKLTPARRSSYIVGEGESCHTAQTRFLTLLLETDNYPTFSQLEEAFSVEAVTKEFFNQYAGLFNQIDATLKKLATKDKTIGNEFKAKNVRTVDFAKKLMGQIVFLYFLQKKGWLGVAKGQDWGTGPHDFLRRLARGEYGAYENFFNDVLEPLFYDALATDRGHDAWCKKFKCRIPFLNGGLFEPLADYDWRKTDITLPNKLFTNTERNDVGDIGTGVLDVFDRYNFTVNEAEPLEKEVAIDPEMLGKVFENLIEENHRKGLGAFYTPREIVHYMCQQSLINYLDTTLKTDKENIPRKDIETFIYLGEQISHYEAVDAKYPIKMPSTIEKHARRIDEKLFTITVCDPAVGSGAYPVGMMMEIVRARCALTPYFNDFHERTPYYFKRHAIQNSLYGVDIDPGAVEIAKLRLWLSLVVDEEDVKQIKPLPNLDYKIVTGNSLLGIEKILFNEPTFRRLEELKPHYFNATDWKQKEKFKHEIDEYILELTNGKKSFDFEVYFSEVFHAKGGFDVVIANPPYVGEKGHKDIFRLIAKGPLGRYYSGKMDLFYFFFHLALNIVKTEGHVTFITTNYYVRATGGKVLRSDFRARSVIKTFVNFNELRIFESALGQHNLITILQKASNSDSRANIATTSRKEFASSTTLRAIVAWGDPKTSYCEVPQCELYETIENYICLTGIATSISADPIQRVLAKMQTAQMHLGDAFNVNQGIVTGADKVSPKHLKEYKIDASVGDGIFVVSLAESAAIEMNGPDLAILRPWFKNSDIQKWSTACKPRSSVIYLDRSCKITAKISNHLRKYKPILEKRREVENELIEWWRLQWPRASEIFLGSKIVAPQRSKTNTFGFNAIPWFASADVYFITDPASNEKRLKSLSALLNSKLYFHWFYHKGKRKGDILELYQNPLAETPIPTISDKIINTFYPIVDRILAVKQRNAEADTSAFEREIDELVYELYGPTPEEKALVQATAK